MGMCSAIGMDAVSFPHRCHEQQFECLALAVSCTFNLPWWKGTTCLMVKWQTQDSWGPSVYVDMELNALANAPTHASGHLGNVCHMLVAGQQKCLTVPSVFRPRHSIVGSFDSDLNIPDRLIPRVVGILRSLVSAVYGSVMANLGISRAQ